MSKQADYKPEMAPFDVGSSNAACLLTRVNSWHVKKKTSERPLPMQILLIVEGGEISAVYSDTKDAEIVVLDLDLDTPRVSHHKALPTASIERTIADNLDDTDVEDRQA